MKKEGIFALIGFSGLMYLLYRKNNAKEKVENMDGKYFTLSELCNSNTAKKNGINNIPNSTQKANLYQLIKNILDPVRECYGAPIYVNSGFRSPEVNKLVGGAANSQHLTGQAADIRGANNTKQNCSS